MKIKEYISKEKETLNGCLRPEKVPEA